ncbi:metal-dependent hydrolase [Mycobacterium sp. Y57]|uniref:metal-dependent hydrolase n=1 Tax=Mycolicibacterium xanthum TaxID=2796469 RepID=UPI001C85F505|nr:metal-dependent hydrolase [Mycolicibacterium xanthum]MBX7430825.1 metal-dependent hydrolase [Mycolicibacterium xanthum]
MTDLEVRRPRFDFTEDVPWEWNPANPGFSFFMNATSIIAVCFEQMIVAAVTEARPLIADPAVAAEAAAFLRQEAQHSASHRKHVNALIANHPGLQHTFDAAIARFDELTATAPLQFRLAYIADLEATFTPSFKLMLDNEATLFRPGDERVGSLFLWHFVEEVEHRSSALVIFDAVVGRPWYRLRVVPAVARHLLSVLALIADGVNTHVPETERKVDARTLQPIYGLRSALRQRMPFGRKGRPPAPPAFSSVPRREKLIAGWRVLLSQTPFHDPAAEPLPAFADEWLARWNRGDDVSRWYTAASHG